MCMCCCTVALRILANCLAAEKGPRAIASRMGWSLPSTRKMTTRMRRGESFNNYDNTNDIVGPVETSPILTTGSEDVIERGVRLRADSAKGALQNTEFQTVVAEFVMPMLAALATTDDCHGAASRTPTETAKVIDVFGHRDLWLDQ